jgi:hypothetical protein
MSREVVDPVSNPRHPFGLPMGTVRGFLSLLICSFFWIVLLSTKVPDVKPLLAHFFLLALVLLAFASSHSSEDKNGGVATLPWLLRALFVGGSVAVVGYCLATDPTQFSNRITPKPDEFNQWWGPFLACTAGGFAGGLFLRFILGPRNYAFLAMRAWLSVVGMIMLTTELALFVGLMNTERMGENFFHTWQAIEICIVSAYFASRS